MIIGNEIDSLIDLFTARNVTLFHACQLLDFKSYLRIGGVPSHACLEKFSSYYTPLESDENDKNNGVWDKVFTNLSDFGETFAKGGNGVPNAFGPILICIKPTALVEAMDVAICLRSAGSKNFDRVREALKTVEDINKLFKNPLYSPYRNDLWYSYKLSQIFNYQNPGAPEISCYFENGSIPLKYVEKIIVDPYIIDGQSLFKYVKKMLASSDLNATIPVLERQHNHPAWPIRKAFYSKLVQCRIEAYPLSLTLSDIRDNNDLSSAMRQWAENILNMESSYQFDRYMRYLCEGTVNELMGSRI